MKTIAHAIMLLGLLSASALAADAAERKYIREGMSEGEVLMKIGKPDSESVDTGGGATTSIKRWIYFPAPADQQTMTTVVLRSGKVTEVSRQVSR